MIVLEKMERTVHIVDDDDSLRKALERRLQLEDYEVRAYSSADEFLESYEPSDDPACLLLDVQMPGISGIELQRELNERGIDLPIVFLTAHGDVPMSVKTLKAGADHFLLKPAKDHILIETVKAALSRSEVTHRERAERRLVRERYDGLSPREREIFALVVSGLMNKVIAADLGLAEITVKVHRASVMRKMQAESLATLVRMAGILGMNDC